MYNKEVDDFENCRNKLKQNKDDKQIKKTVSKELTVTKSVLQQECTEEKNVKSESKDSNGKEAQSLDTKDEAESKETLHIDISTEKVKAKEVSEEESNRKEPDPLAEAVKIEQPLEENATSIESIESSFNTKDEINTVGPEVKESICKVSTANTKESESDNESDGDYACSSEKSSVKSVSLVKSASNEESQRSEDDIENAAGKEKESIKEDIISETSSSSSSEWEFSESEEENEQDYNPPPQLPKKPEAPATQTSIPASLPVPSTPITRRRGDTASTSATFVLPVPRCGAPPPPPSSRPPPPPMSPPAVNPKVKDLLQDTTTRFEEFKKAAQISTVATSVDNVGSSVPIDESEEEESEWEEWTEDEDDDDNEMRAEGEKWENILSSSDGPTTFSAEFSIQI